MRTPKIWSACWRFWAPPPSTGLSRPTVAAPAWPWPEPDIIDTLVQRLYERALAAGAECLVVSCQMCQANLDLSQERISRKFGQDYYLPVFYFTD